MSRLATILMALALCSACSTKRAFVHTWNARYIEAARAQDQGRWEEADAHYVQLVEHAPSDDARRAALYRQALLRAERGRTGDALRSFLAIHDEGVSDEHGARSAQQAVALLLEAGHTEHAVMLARSVVDVYPDFVAAEHALHTLRSQAEGREEVLVWSSALREIVRDARGTDLEDYALWELGELCLESLGDAQCAIDAWRALCALDFDVHHLADDGCYEVGVVLAERDQIEEALEVFGRVGGTYETSWYVGFYGSEWADDARWAQGMIHLERTRRFELAAGVFEAYLRDFPEHVKADDAAWMLARAYALMGDDGKRKRALSELVERYPESRYVGRAKAALNGAP
ncbi:MAG: tetratricopeptide repeat protein [Myxococcota bacterium]